MTKNSTPAEVSGYWKNHKSQEWSQSVCNKIRYWQIKSDLQVLDIIEKDFDKCHNIGQIGADGKQNLIVKFIEQRCNEGL